MDWTWSFTLRPVLDGATRLLVRTRLPATSCRGAVCSAGSHTAGRRLDHRWHLLASGGRAGVKLRCSRSDCTALLARRTVEVARGTRRGLACVRAGRTSASCARDQARSSTWERTTTDALSQKAAGARNQAREQCVGRVPAGRLPVRAAPGERRPNPCRGTLGRSHSAGREADQRARASRATHPGECDRATHCSQ